MPNQLLQRSHFSEPGSGAVTRGRRTFGLHRTTMTRHVPTGRKWGLLLLFSPVILLVLAILLVCLPFYLVYGCCLRLLVQALWVARGKRILLIYSRSPVWQAHVEDTWLPQVAEQSIVINWSDGSTQGRSHPFATCVFRFWAPRHGFNPMAILFGPGLRTQRVEFYDAFRDWKHGNESALRAAETKLFSFANERGA